MRLRTVTIEAKTSPKKKLQTQNGVGLQYPFQPRGECQDGNDDTGQDGCQKSGVHCIERGQDIETQQRLPEWPSCASANAHHQLFINAEDEGHGAAGDAGYDSAHPITKPRAAKPTYSGIVRLGVKCCVVEDSESSTASVLCVLTWESVVISK